MTIDTLAYARRLKSAGVDPEQAEAHADAIRDAVTEGAATKADLQAGLAATEGRLKAEWRGDLLRVALALGAIMVVGFGAVLAMLARMLA